jgi:hypothetical protein
LQLTHRGANRAHELLHQRSPLPGIVLMVEPSQPELERCEDLADTIVELQRDSPSFFVLRAHELMDEIDARLRPASFESSIIGTHGPIILLHD